MNLDKLSKLNLDTYDYMLVIDRSYSMITPEGNTTRWKQAHEISKGVANICEKFDDDGIDIILFDDAIKEFNNVTAVKVDDIFRKYGPRGSTDTAAALETALKNYLPKKGFFGKKPANLAGKKPLIVIVLTDGSPNDQRAVKRTIIDATKSISSREQLGISFLQVGNDNRARKFLKSLDDDLENEGAKFDVVDTKTYDEVNRMSPEDILIGALTD